MDSPLNAPHEMNAVVHNLAAVEYFAHPGLSNSGMKGMHPRPAHFRAALDQDEEDVKDESIALLLGTMAHRLILEPGTKANDKIALRPEGMKFNTKEGKAWRDAQYKMGFTSIMTKDEHDSTHAMANAICSHPLASHLLRHGQSEVSYFLTRPTGFGSVVMKARVDFVPEASDFLMDIKTSRSASPEAFAAEVARRRYHCQAAHYLDIHNTLVPDDRRSDMLFFVVEKRAPFLVAVYRLSNEFIHLGRMAIGTDVKEFARCTRENDWPGYDLNPVTLSPPKWLDPL